MITSALYMQALCVDRHISAEVTELNGMVCADSCVELFCMVAPEQSQEYFNLEVNCCGVMHVGFGPDRYSRKLIPGNLATSITAATSRFFASSIPGIVLR